MIDATTRSDLKQASIDVKKVMVAKHEQEYGPEYGALVYNILMEEEFIRLEKRWFILLHTWVYASISLCDVPCDTTGLRAAIDEFNAAYPEQAVVLVMDEAVVK